MIERVAPAILFVAVSIILAHFFNDADRHRGICETIRARYLLPGLCPRDLWMDEANREARANNAGILEDYVKYRLVKIHFGLISLIVLLGLGLWMVAIGIVVHECCIEQRYAIAVFLVVVVLLVWLVQVAFIEQQRGTARRIKDIEGELFSGKGCFAQQCEYLFKPRKVHPLDKNRFWRWSKRAMKVLERRFWPHILSNSPGIVWLFYTGLRTN